MSITPKPPRTAAERLAAHKAETERLERKAKQEARNARIKAGQVKDPKTAKEVNTQIFHLDRARGIIVDSGLATEEQVAEVMQSLEAILAEAVGEEPAE